MVIKMKLAEALQERADLSSRAAGVMFTRDMLSETGAMLSINVLLPHEAYISQETPVLTQAKSISGQRLSQAGLR